MTEGNDDGSNLVRVRAQVMMRDDSTGGWVPMGGGGLSNVSVRKRILNPDRHENKPEYLIHGRRISDQTIVLSCPIKKDFQYNKVMPTFHHWKTGDHKYGLTFQTAADARAFDKGVRLAVDDILDGLNEIPCYYHGYHGYLTDVGDDDVFMAVNLPVERDGSRSSSGSVTTCSSGSRHTPTTSIPTPDHPPYHTITTIATNTPITTPDLPLHQFHHHHHHLHHHHHYFANSGGSNNNNNGITTTNTSPASTISTISNPTTISSSMPNPPPPPPPFSHTNHQHLHRMTYIPRSKPGNHGNGNNGSEKSFNDNEKGETQEKIQVAEEPYAYVQFAKSQPLPLHEHSYPLVEGYKGMRRDSISSLKKQQQSEFMAATPTQTTPPLISGKKMKKKDHRSRKSVKVRCKHCNDIFVEDFNTRGSCEYAPDWVHSAIDKISCISCARCMLYHCMSDAEGEFPHHPCECGGSGGAMAESCGRRWLGLVLLSLFVPCLWCYLPLRACHRCGVACRLCGGKHEAS